MTENLASIPMESNEGEQGRTGPACCCYCSNSPPMYKLLLSGRAPLMNIKSKTGTFIVCSTDSGNPSKQLSPPYCWIDGLLSSRKEINGTCDPNNPMASNNIEFFAAMLCGLCTLASIGVQPNIYLLRSNVGQIQTSALWRRGCCQSSTIQTEQVGRRSIYHSNLHNIISDLCFNITLDIDTFCQLSFGPEIAADMFLTGPKDLKIKYQGYFAFKIILPKFHLLFEWMQKSDAVTLFCPATPVNLHLLASLTNLHSLAFSRM